MRTTHLPAPLEQSSAATCSRTRYFDNAAILTRIFEDAHGHTDPAIPGEAAGDMPYEPSPLRGDVTFYDHPDCLRVCPYRRLTNVRPPVEFGIFEPLLTPETRQALLDDPEAFASLNPPPPPICRRGIDQPPRQGKYELVDATLCEIAALDDGLNQRSQALIANEVRPGCPCAKRLLESIEMVSPLALYAWIVLLKS